MTAPENSRNICGFSLTHSPTRLFYESREKRTSPCVELVFFEGQGRADFGQIDDEVGLCLVPKTKYDLSGRKSQIENFRFPSRGTEPFLTESLILAQNERWRRG